jgi:hypothetical protein
MYKFAVAILLLSAPAFALDKTADPAALQSVRRSARRHGAS